MRPRANDRQSANDIFKFIFVNEKCYILIQISLEYVPDGPISNNSELVQIMFWYRLGEKPTEPDLVYWRIYMRHSVSVS